jgi:alkylhydroperoxidase/carboxymuconolactone decarboxylase family protein YurZ
MAAAPNNASAEANQQMLLQKAYGRNNTLPPTDNQWIAIAGALALYNPTLFNASQALFQHTLVLGL